MGLRTAAGAGTSLPLPATTLEKENKKENLKKKKRIIEN